jgi:hypothetical protein
MARPSSVCSVATGRQLAGRALHCESCHTNPVSCPDCRGAAVLIPPRLSGQVTGLECLYEAVAEDDDLAGEAILDGVLDEIDTPLEGARLARAVIAARDAGRLEGRLAATALVDLASGSRQLLCAGLIERCRARRRDADAGGDPAGGVTTPSSPTSRAPRPLRDAPPDRLHHLRCRTARTDHPLLTCIRNVPARLTLMAWPAWVGLDV